MRASELPTAQTKYYEHVAGKPWTVQPYTLKIMRWNNLSIHIFPSAYSIYSVLLLKAGPLCSEPFFRSAADGIHEFLCISSFAGRETQSHYTTEDFGTSRAVVISKNMYIVHTQIKEVFSAEGCHGRLLFHSFALASTV